MTTKTPIFFVGATGYIGGTILSRLLSHPNASSFEITAIVRSPEKAKKLESFGVKAVVGSFKTDLQLLEKLAEDAHVIFQCADSDDLAVTQAILKGLKNKHNNLGDLPTLIHTSGGACVITDLTTKGNTVTGDIFDDSNPEQLEALPAKALHRNVDLAIVEADKAGYARTYIVLPSTVFGIASNPLVDAGIVNPFSIQLPIFIRAAIARGRGGMIGKGVVRWANVHIDDVADLFIVLFDAIVSNPDKLGHGRDGYYFSENGEHSWYDISKEIGRTLVSLNLADDDEPTPFTEEELAKYFGSAFFGELHGSNCRCRATHSRSIGWKPKYGNESILVSIKTEVEAVLKAQK